MFSNEMIYLFVQQFINAQVMAQNSDHKSLRTSRRGDDKVIKRFSINLRNETRESI